MQQKAPPIRQARLEHVWEFLDAHPELPLLMLIATPAIRESESGDHALHMPGAVHGDVLVRYNRAPV